jgi:hypothetical protein
VIQYYNKISTINQLKSWKNFSFNFNMHNLQQNFTAAIGKIYWGYKSARLLW